MVPKPDVMTLKKVCLLSSKPKTLLLLANETIIIAL
jgi:hypothetical protein